MCEPAVRFDWTFQPYALLDAPERYRTLYAFAAATLNLSTSLWALAAFLCDPNPMNRACAQDILLEGQRLGAIQGDARDGVTALRQSMLATRELLLLCHDAEEVPSPALKQRRRRFPRFFLTTLGGRALSQLELNAFVVGEVGQAAMTLAAGALQLQDQALPGTAGETTTLPDGEDPRRFRDSLATLLRDGCRPDRRSIIEYLKTNADGYQVRYNLACYFSRDVLDPLAGEEHRRGAARAAVEQLQRCMEECPVTDRGGIAQQAVRDPALVGLRQQEPIAFQDIAAGGKVRPPPVVELEPVEALKHRILERLVGRLDAEARLSAHLVAMHWFGDTMPREELLCQENPYVQVVEENMARQPLECDEDDRRWLARLLFLPAWTGVAPRFPSAPIVGDVPPGPVDPPAPDTVT